MRVDKKYKLEKVVEKPGRNAHRPVLQHTYLRRVSDDSWQLEATDSYKAVIITIAADDIGENDSEGFVPVDALKRAAKNDGVLQAGEQIVAGGMSEARPCPGDPVNLPQIFDGAKHVLDDDATEFTIGLDAKLLFELAQGLGSDVVQLRMVSALKPIGVVPAGRGSGGNAAYGLLMPVRIDQ